MERVLVQFRTAQGSSYDVCSTLLAWRGVRAWKVPGPLTLFPAFQVVLLSATMPMDVLEVTKKFMRDPIRILVKKEELTLEGIRQFYINVEREVRDALF